MRSPSKAVFHEAVGKIDALGSGVEPWRAQFHIVLVTGQ
jgi:threonine dehydrogenase-like Zn-dependent dehydrogenase